MGLIALQVDVDGGRMARLTMVETSRKFVCSADQFRPAGEFRRNRETMSKLYIRGKKLEKV